MNANRNSTETADAVVATNPTMTSSVGTTLYTAAIGSTGFKSKVGGEDITDLWILKADTKYVMRFTADAASTRTIIKMAWDEA